MKAIDRRWETRDDPDRYKGMSAVKAANRAYSAMLEQARKDWARLHAPMEPGRGLDGRPLQRGKAVKQDADD